MDVAFIDRDNAKAAVGKPEEGRGACAEGPVHPHRAEGTRLDTTEVGPFKKGPFRIAMSAGIPIVPWSFAMRRSSRPATRRPSIPEPSTSSSIRRSRSMTGP